MELLSSAEAEDVKSKSAPSSAARNSFDQIENHSSKQADDDNSEI